MKNKWRIISFDVWGNEDDGWEINNMFSTNLTVSLNEEFSEKEILTELVNIRFFIKKVKTKKLLNVEIGEDEIWIENTDNGFPLCKLVLIKGE